MKQDNQVPKMIPVHNSVVSQLQRCIPAERLKLESMHARVVQLFGSLKEIEPGVTEGIAVPDLLPEPSTDRTSIASLGECLSRLAQQVEVRRVLIQTLADIEKQFSEVISQFSHTGIERQRKRDLLAAKLRNLQQILADCARSSSDTHPAPLQSLSPFLLEEAIKRGYIDPPSGVDKKPEDRRSRKTARKQEEQELLLAQDQLLEEEQQRDAALRAQRISEVTGEARVRLAEAFSGFEEIMKKKIALEPFAQEGRNDIARKILALIVQLFNEPDCRKFAQLAFSDSRASIYIDNFLSKFNVASMEDPTLQSFLSTYASRLYHTQNIGMYLRGLVENYHVADLATARAVRAHIAFAHENTANVVRSRKEGLHKTIRVQRRKLPTKIARRMIVDLLTELAKQELFADIGGELDVWLEGSPEQPAVFDDEEGRLREKALLLERADVLTGHYAKPVSTLKIGNSSLSMSHELRRTTDINILSESEASTKKKAQ